MAELQTKQPLNGALTALTAGRVRSHPDCPISCSHPRVFAAQEREPSALLPQILVCLPAPLSFSAK